MFMLLLVSNLDIEKKAIILLTGIMGYGLALYIYKNIQL